MSYYCLPKTEQFIIVLSTPIIQSWWRVMAASDCNLSWRWWSDTLWVTPTRLWPHLFVFSWLKLTLFVEVSLQSHRCICINIHIYIMNEYDWDFHCFWKFNRSSGHRCLFFVKFNRQLITGIHDESDGLILSEQCSQDYDHSLPHSLLCYLQIIVLEYLLQFHMCIYVYVKVASSFISSFCLPLSQLCVWFVHKLKYFRCCF